MNTYYVLKDAILPLATKNIFSNVYFYNKLQKCNQLHFTSSKFIGRLMTILFCVKND